jgi:hypothetical protein
MQLAIENIKIRDVQDTGGILDAQDPCVSISLGKQTKETARFFKPNHMCFFDALLR